MELRKNWFTYTYLALYGMFLSYALFSGIYNMGYAEKYPFLWYGGSIAAMGALWLIVHVLSYIAGILSDTDLKRKESGGRRAGAVAEGVFVTVVIAVSAVLRIWVVNYLPMQPASDFETYFNVAGLLSKGTLIKDGVGYCDYISQFPHVIGFPFVLSLLYRVTGISVKAGLYLNLAAGLISVYLVYRIARLISGKTGGIIALVLMAFWPSQILYGTQLASEPVFTCAMLFSALIATYLHKNPEGRVKASKLLLLNIVLGISLALAGAVRPVSLILLAAIIICILPYRNMPENRNAGGGINTSGNRNVLEGINTSGNINAAEDISAEDHINQRGGDMPEDVMENPGIMWKCMSRGWSRALIILISYALCSQIINGAVSKAVDRELPGITVSFGYNLMVGMNIESKGQWNEEDAGFMDNRFQETDSAAEAHKAARTVAFERMAQDPAGTANLALEKYTLLWKDDSYASYWNLLFMGDQGTLTGDREAFINGAAFINNIYYTMCLFFSLVAGIWLWYRKEAGPMHMLILFFVGYAILHMLVENQNRYHYSILPIFAILAAQGISGILLHRRAADERQNAAAVPEVPPGWGGRHEAPTEDIPQKEAVTHDAPMEDIFQEGAVSEEVLRKETSQETTMPDGALKKEIPRETAAHGGAPEKEIPQEEKQPVKNPVKAVKDHRFDMLKAIKDGHVTVTVTEKYLKEARENGYMPDHNTKDEN